MEIINLNDSTTLTKQSETDYTLDWGTVKKGSDRNRQLKLEDLKSNNITIRTSCGGCTKATIIKDNILNINYNTNLLGRILKSVYIFDNGEKTTIKLNGKVV